MLIKEYGDSIHTYYIVSTRHIAKLGLLLSCIVCTRSDQWVGLTDNSINCSMILYVNCSINSSWQEELIQLIES